MTPRWRRQRPGPGKWVPDPLTAPCEPWEYPVSADVATRLVSSRGGSRPVPAAAAEDLADLVGPADAVMVPAAIRPTGDGLVWTPDQVVGVGPRGVALWIDGLPYPRVIGAIPRGELVATVHLMAGKHSCLVLTGDPSVLTLRYQSSGWPAVGDLLTRARAQSFAPGDRPPPGAGAPSARWEDLPGSPLVALGDLRRPRCLASNPERLRGRPRRRARPAALAALTRHELVVVLHVLGQEPVKRGVELLAVARGAITGLASKGSLLTVHTRAGDYRVELDPGLADTVQKQWAPLIVSGPPRGRAELDSGKAAG